MKGTGCNQYLLYVCLAQQGLTVAVFPQQWPGLLPALSRNVVPLGLGLGGPNWCDSGVEVLL